MRDIAELPGLHEEGVVLLCGAGMETVEKFIASDAVDVVERLKEVGKNFEEGIRPPSQRRSPARSANWRRDITMRPLRAVAVFVS